MLTKARKKVKVLVIAPHPDDESLGCGGSLLKHKNIGDDIHWLIMTSTHDDDRYSVDFTQSRQKEIEQVSRLYDFESVTVLNFKPATLDHLPMSDIIDKVSALVQKIEPDVLYLPYRGDAHSDHKIVFDAGIACTKSFRYPSVKTVRVYETLSETDFSLNPDNSGFRPNYYINIEDFLDKKIEILRLYLSEMKPSPFPRSEEAVRAQALLRGQVSGSRAAEAFMSLKDVWYD